MSSESIAQEKQWTESDIQYSLFKWLPVSHKYKAHGTSFYGGYADFISMTKAYRVTEYEIKLSFSDFKADFKKRNKHKQMEAKRPDSYDGTYHFPNYFYFVIPENLLLKIKPLIPEYAGIITMPTPKTIMTAPRWIIQAPLLHKEKAGEIRLKEMLISMSWKWYILYGKTNRITTEGVYR